MAHQGDMMPMPTAEDTLALHLAELGNKLYFLRGYRYAPPRKFEADFAVWRTCPFCEGCPDFQRPFALIEVTGGIYSKQAHGSVTGVLKDNERLYHAFLNGWHMIRVTPQQVESGEAKGMIEEALR